MIINGNALSPQQTVDAIRTALHNDLLATGVGFVLPPSEIVVAGGQRIGR